MSRSGDLAYWVDGLNQWVKHFRILRKSQMPAPKKTEPVQIALKNEARTQETASSAPVTIPTSNSTSTSPNMGTSPNPATSSSSVPTESPIVMVIVYVLIL